MRKTIVCLGTLFIIGALSACVPSPAEPQTNEGEGGGGSPANAGAAKKPAETTAPTPKPEAPKPKEPEKTVTPTPKPQPKPEPAKEPDHITVQHILIAFKGRLPGRPITRTQAEAEKLANELLEKAKKGEDFGTLVKEHTDDSAPGIYKMANHGVKADREQKIYARGGMVAAFGDVGFPLKVGEIGMAGYDRVKSPYGWHIIKRIK
ncbi:MAG: peptidylprolyl isomerase [Planctomycetota bacterium]